MNFKSISDGVQLLFRIMNNNQNNNNNNNNSNENEMKNNLEPE